MEHKLEAYFRAMDIDLGAFGIPLVAGSATLDIITVLIALVEFLFGMYYVLGMHQRLTAVFGTLFMAFMTSVTLWIYLYDPVPDCGCFGDAIVLTNAQTLAKNIVLLAVAILLLVYRRHMVRCISRRNEWFATSTSFLYILALSIYSIRMRPTFAPHSTANTVHAMSMKKRGNNGHSTTEKPSPTIHGNSSRQRAKRWCRHR